MRNKLLLSFCSILFRAKGLKDMNGKEEHQFEHPWIQTALMFLGKLRCM